MKHIDDNNFSNLGVLIDTRSDEAKARDWKHEELAGAVILNWREKPKSEWKRYTKRDQSSSSSCVAQSSAKGMEIVDTKHIVFSAHPIYRRRVNFPEGGMYLQNAGDICKNFGTTTEALDPSQKLGEQNMNRDITVETPNKIYGYVSNINFKSIDVMAEAIETHGHVVALFHSDRDEYLKEIPKYDPKGVIDIGHCICFTDYFLYNGEKVLLLEDSAGLFSTIDGNGNRLITQEFLEKRFGGAMYFIPVTPPADEKPRWTFTKALSYGMKVEPDVAALQNILKYEGLFPTTVPSSGNYLDITAKSILAWQRKHAIAPEAELATLKGRTVGPKTRAKLNELYSE